MNRLSTFTIGEFDDGDADGRIEGESTVEKGEMVVLSDARGRFVVNIVGENVEIGASDCC